MVTLLSPFYRWHDWNLEWLNNFLQVIKEEPVFKGGRHHCPVRALFTWTCFCSGHSVAQSHPTLCDPMDCSTPGLLQFSSVTQSCPTVCDPMNRSTPGLPVHHQLPEFTQTHVHRVSDAIQPSHPLLSPSPPAPDPSQHQSLFQWVNSSHEVAKVLEFQL